MSKTPERPGPLKSFRLSQTSRLVHGDGERCASPLLTDGVTSAYQGINKISRQPVEEVTAPSPFRAIVIPAAPECQKDRHRDRAPRMIRDGGLGIQTSARFSHQTKEVAPPGADMANKCGELSPAWSPARRLLVTEPQQLANSSAAPSSPVLAVELESDIQHESRDQEYPYLEMDQDHGAPQLARS